jgi:hypothetical protein
LTGGNNIWAPKQETYNANWSCATLYELRASVEEVFCSIIGQDVLMIYEGRKTKDADGEAVGL